MVTRYADPPPGMTGRAGPDPTLGRAKQVELRRRSACARAESGTRGFRHRECRQAGARLAVEHGPDDPAAVAPVEHVRRVRPGTHDLLYQLLVDAQAGQRRQQAGQPDRLDGERLKLDGALPPDLARGPRTGLRERIGRGLRRRIGDEGGDRVPLDDVRGRAHGGGELASGDRLVSHVG